MKKIRLDLETAKQLAVDFLARNGMPVDHAAIVADHLIYATLAGHDFAGFSRLLPLAERIRTRGAGGKVTITHETPQSAMIDGADVNGYVTSIYGMDKAIELAKKSGVGIVGVNNSWFSGMLRYYVERAAKAGLVGIHAANTTARVAPYGSIDPLLGTNPIAVAFPAPERPFVIDFSTAAMTWGDVIYHQQLNKPLPEGHAVDPDGKPTVDPAAALAGTILAWGGPRGSSLAVLIQALGILGGSDPVVGESGRWGYFFMAFDPALLMPSQEFSEKIGALRSAIENSRSMNPEDPVRAPGSRAACNVEEGLRRNWIEVAEEIHTALL